MRRFALIVMYSLFLFAFLETEGITRLRLRFVFVFRACECRCATGFRAQGVYPACIWVAMYNCQATLFRVKKFRGVLSLKLVMRDRLDDLMSDAGVLVSGGMVSERVI
jgi:hypothetical protein